jgi:hydrogenase maturation protein HypF
MLVFTWDGVGLGPDGSLWGGEALAGKPGQWRRVGALRPFRLPGGERAGREPWRSAAAVCWESGLDCTLGDASDPLLFSFWQQRKNSPATTAAGRLFDAASALCGVLTRASFEGQGPMQFEALAATHGRFDDARVIRLSLSRADDVYSADWSALIPMLMDGSTPLAERAAHFHVSMAYCVLQQAMQIRENTSINYVGLGGGVFQNRVLTEKCIALLHKNGFEVTLPALIPVNDAGISFGQIVEHAYGSG